MDLGLRGKYALVVGGSSGIGLATAPRLLQEGANVLLCSRTEAGLVEVSARLQAETGRQVRWYAADVTRPQDVQDLAAWAQQQAPALDCLVCCVGGSRRAGFEELAD